MTGIIIYVETHPKDQTNWFDFLSFSFCFPDSTYSTLFLALFFNEKIKFYFIRSTVQLSGQVIYQEQNLKLCCSLKYNKFLTSALDCQNCMFFWILCRLEKMCSKISCRTSQTLDASVVTLHIKEPNFLQFSSNKI